MSKPFNYPCYQFLFPHMDLEARTYLAQQSPLFKRINKETPIKFTKIEISADAMTFDDTTYTLYRHYNNPRNPDQYKYYFRFAVSNSKRPGVQPSEDLLPIQRLREAQAYMLRKILSQNNIEIGTMSIRSMCKPEFSSILTTLSNMNVRIGSLELSRCFSVPIPIIVEKLVLSVNSWHSLNDLYRQQHRRIEFRLEPTRILIGNRQNHSFPIVNVMRAVNMFQQRERNTPIHVSREIETYNHAARIMQHVSVRPNAQIMQRLEYRDRDMLGLVVLPKSEVFNVTVQLEVVTVEEKEVFVIHLKIVNK